MGAVLQERLNSWDAGVNSAAPADLLPDNTSPRALNSVLVQTSQGVALPAKRPGWAVVNNNVATTSAIIGQFPYRRRISAITTQQFHIVVDAGGNLLQVLPGGTLSTISSVIFTPGFNLPAAATMNNLLHIVNGQDQIVFNGTIAYASGLPAPAAPTSNPGAAGVMTGAYDVAITYFDQASNLESSLSGFVTVNPVAQTIQVFWVASNPHPFTHTNIYLRKQAIQTQFFRVAQIAFPTNSTIINLTDAQLNALIIRAPDTVENNPIPDNVIDVVPHVSRLFACDLQKVYYSNLNQPEAFDPNNFFTTNTDDGKPLTSLHSAHEVLIIFKRDSMWALYGEDPTNWIVRLVTPDVGCLSQASIQTIEGVTYWWSEQGQMGWNGSGAPVPVARDRLRPDISPTALSFPALDPTPAQNFIGPVSAVDPIGQRVIWAVPTINSARNNLIFSLQYSLNSWETNGWTSLDAASLASIEDSNSIPQIYLGTYGGQIFVLNQSALNDGVLSGTTTGTISSSTTSTLNDVAATFLTAGYGLKDRYVYVYDSAGNVAARSLITANTGTQVTAAFTVAPPVGAVYSIGGIDFQFDTGWRTMGDAFLKKRYEYGYFLLGSNTAGAPVHIDLFINYNSLVPMKTYTVNTSVGGLVWDVGQWDVDLWDFGGSNRARKRLASTGFVYRYRLRHALPGADIVVFKIGTRAEALTDKN